MYTIASYRSLVRRRRGSVRPLCPRTPPNSARSAMSAARRDHPAAAPPPLLQNDTGGALRSGIMRHGAPYPSTRPRHGGRLNTRRRPAYSRARAATHNTRTRRVDSAAAAGQNLYTQHAIIGRRLLRRVDCTARQRAIVSRSPSTRAHGTVHVLQPVSGRKTRFVLSCKLFSLPFHSSFFPPQRRVR